MSTLNLTLTSAVSLKVIRPTCVLPDLISSPLTNDARKLRIGWKRSLRVLPDASSIIYISWYPLLAVTQ